MTRASKQLAIIYTGLVPLEGTKRLAQELMPGVRIVSIVDDSLLDDVLTAGRLTKAVTRRICDYARAAQDGGADVILNQCSSVGDAVYAARAVLNVPYLRIDEPMAQKAVAIGGRVAVAATLRTTLDPTCRLVERTAAEMNKQVELVSVLAEGAFETLKAGDTAQHNAMVMQAIADAGDVDVVLLAQGSMVVLQPELEKQGVTALSSPESGLKAARDLLYRS